MLPVRPLVREVLGVPCVASLAEIDEPIDLVDVFRRADAAPTWRARRSSVGAKAFWLQLGLVSPEAREIAEARRHGLRREPVHGDRAPQRVALVR